MLACARCRMLGRIQMMQAQRIGGKRRASTLHAELNKWSCRPIATTSFTKAVSPLRKRGIVTPSRQGRHLTERRLATPTTSWSRPPRGWARLAQADVTTPRRLSTTNAARQRARNGPGAGLTQRQQVELVEGLYTSGQISKEEWRESVLVQAGLKGSDVGVEEQVRKLREWFAAVGVPEVLLEDEERVMHERLFGPARAVEFHDEEDQEVDFDDGQELGTGILQEDRKGELREVEYDDVVEEDAAGRTTTSNRRPNDILAEDIRYAMEKTGLSDVDAVDTAENQGEAFRRTHPLTAHNRFATSPSTLEMPRMSFIDSVTAMLSGISNTHLSSSAHKIFGGAGLPYSTSTPARGRLMPQKPISLDAQQAQMSEIEADVFMSTLMPGMYSSIMSVLIETRRRLGTEWAEGLVRKAEAGSLRLLDAGAGGAGVLAVREMLRAEWERMHEDGHGDESPMALAEADGSLGGENVRAPSGAATVLTGSDTLRKRSSKLLDNTTFVPRLPDYVHSEEAKKKGKFDIILAPHGLWPLREDYLRKTHVQNLWSLLSTDGGVLLLLEKGVARGFELVAGARDMLLDTRIASPDAQTRPKSVDEEGTEPQLLHVAKETGMIIAPCTNHTACPMYLQKGLIKGRRDVCTFSQRYHRPQFLQNIFGTKGRNHEDVEFAYLSVMRGKDLRPKQDSEVTDRAFAGYEHVEAEDTPESPASLSLPRAVYPPLKRQGHVILDLCTPAGKLERWTIPKSFSKVAYRDARKASWGDLWALGAKTRVPRTAVVKKNRLDPEYADLDVKAKKGDGKRARKAEATDGFGSDEFGRVTFDGGVVGENEGGRMRGRKVKGIRDRRDKRGDGNGRKLRDKEFE